MRAAILFVLGFILGACGHTVPSAPPPPPPALPDVVDGLVSKTVALTVEDGEGNARAFCTGVWVSPSNILTAEHCVEDTPIGSPVQYATRRDIDRKPYPMLRQAKLAAHEPAFDLALLHAEDAPGHDIAVTAVYPLWQGQTALTMGHSIGLWWTFSSGEVTAIRQLEISGLDIVWVQGDAPISPGNSGGGLFDSAGDLIGIAHGTFTRGQLLNVWVHRDYIAGFLRANQ